MNNQNIQDFIISSDKLWNINPDQELIKNMVRVSSKKINLISFTCSTINSEYMFDLKNYDKYISLSTEGNNLTENLEFFKEIALSQQQNQCLELTILIGNTDPYYIYSGQLKYLPSIKKEKYLERMSIRWNQYEINLHDWIKDNVPNLKYKIINWFNFENETKKSLGLDFEKGFNSTLTDIDLYFNNEVFESEKKSLLNAFGKGKYFENISPPIETILNDWIRRKFAEYTLQGLWIKLLFPNSILIQNEKPTMLRYSMYQPLIQKYLNSNLPNIFPYGDQEGYA